MTSDTTTYHAPSEGGLFASAALCGAKAADEADGHLRLHAVDTEVTCVACREVAAR